MLKYGRSQAAHIKRANCLFSGPAGIEVSVGSENAPADIFINSVKRAQFDWESDNNGDDTADIEIRAGTNLLWNTQYKRVVDSGIFEPHSGLREPDNCGCGVCEDGDCDMDDGDQLSSIAFRLALGPVGYNTHGGYLWFKCETLPTVTPALFNLNVAPSDYITVYSNGIGGVLSQISNTSYKGRTIQIQSISGGVQLDIYRQNDPDYHKGWQITAPSASVIRFEQYDAANNIIRDVTYTCAVDGDDRTSSRYDALAYCTTSRKSTLIDARKVVEEEVVTQLSRTLSGVQATYITVGRGTAAVERVSSRSELNGRYDSWETTGYSYWTDSFNHRRNGKLKLRQSPGGQWEYNIWDQSGRNKLRVTPIDGSVVTTDFAADSELEFNPDGNYPQLKARVTATSYTPLAGDDSNYRDALQPRTISEYVVKNAAPILTSRSWNIYNRIIVNSLPAISNTVIRAASQASAISEPANRISISVSTLDDPAIELILQGRPLYQQNPDGSCTTWEYALNAAELTITSYSGTTTAPMGLLDRSTYDVEVIDTLTGHTLSRETYLFTDAVEAPILAAEYHDYNAANGRLLATYYSDGTFIAHTWDCCRIISTIARDGQVTSQIAPPFIDAGESKTLYLSQGSLPGAGGNFPANHAVTDPIGRG
ncbi:MAG: hypothetical protein PHO37_05015, partial [Kiritimatiellae bacterium]|nr:hypothetical protein [Kiritimatiellia bacterium]